MSVNLLDHLDLPQLRHLCYHNPVAHFTSKVKSLHSFTTYYPMTDEDMEHLFTSCPQLKKVTVIQGDSDDVKLSYRTLQAIITYRLLLSVLDWDAYCSFLPEDVAKFRVAAREIGLLPVPSIVNGSEER